MNLESDVHTLNEELQRACTRGQLDKAKRLISQGADCTVETNFCIRWASANGFLDVVKYLVSQGADCTDNENDAVSWASENDHLELVKYLVSQGADCTATNNYAIKLASEYGNREVVKYLVSQGANPSDISYDLVKHIVKNSTALKEMNELALDEEHLLPLFLKRYFEVYDDTPLNYIDKCPVWHRPYVLKFI